MAYLETLLQVKKSTLDGAGKGLFTKKNIEKNSFIVEYTGTITTWKEVNHDEGRNPYIFYVTRNRVIDASNHKDSLGRYANDAKGLKRQKGILNNSSYINQKGKILLQALKDIPAGAEIFVSYGKEYWDAVKYNTKLTPVKKKK